MWSPDFVVSKNNSSRNSKTSRSTKVRPRFTGVDTHGHVFIHNMKMVEGRRYTPTYDATISNYISMLDNNGLSHGVLVQISFFGTDNSCLLEALRQEPKRLRGIAVVAPSITVEELCILDQVGVVGVRLNLIGLPDPDFRSAEWKKHLRRVAELGWQVEVQAEAWRLPKLMPWLLAASVPVVIDHFGRPDQALGTSDPGFQYLLTQARTWRVWVKLSGAYRNGVMRHGEHIASSAASALLRQFGADRLLWGSDWPHTCFEQLGAADAALQTLHRWLPDAADRHAVLVETPRLLFGFDVTPDFPRTNDDLKQPDPLGEHDA